MSQDELDLIWRLLHGQELPNGFKSPWNVTRQRTIGTAANPNGPCSVAGGCRIVTAAEIGVVIAGKRFEWKLHQAAFAHRYQHVPLNEHDDAGNSSRSEDTWVIAHNCGRDDCSVTDHMSVVHHKHNLIQCRCHDALKKQDLNDRLHRRNTSYALGKDCFWVHKGPQCFYNFSNKQ